MGGVPKQRHTKSRRNKRRSQIHLHGITLTICPHCKKPVLPHTVCKECGYYKGREVINVMAKKEKKEKAKHQESSK
ncbi:MAG: 50S ribosomal protein L32 [bacterium]|nr:50S ribosomal protein L32 [bacterium]